MNREFKKRITQNLTYLKERLVDLDPIIDKLIEKDVIQLDHRSKIEQVSPPTPQRKFNEFIQILLSSPEPSAYHVFIEALNDERHFFIVDRLQNCQIKESYGTVRSSSSLQNTRGLHRQITSSVNFNQDDAGASSGTRNNPPFNVDQMTTVMTRVLSDFGGKLTEELVSNFEKNRRSDMLEMEKRMEEKLQEFKLDWEVEKERLLKTNEKAINNLRESFEKLRKSNDELTRLREKYENLKQIQKDMREKENERWQRLSTTNTQNIQLRDKNEELEGQIKTLEEKVAVLESENKLLKSNEDQDRLEIEHLIQENRTLEKDLADKEKERNDLKQEVEKAHRQIQEMLQHQEEESRKQEDDIYRNALEQQNEKLDEIYQAVHALGAKEKSIYMKQSSKGLYVGGSAVHRNQRPIKTSHQQQRNTNTNNE